jgi:hypothetical protein
LSCLFSGGRGALSAFTGAGIIFGILPPHGQSSPMSNSAITADVHQPFDIHLDFRPQGSFHFEVGSDDSADFVGFIIGEVKGAFIGIDPGFSADFVGAGGSNPEDIGQCYHYPLIFRNVNSGYACQLNLTSVYSLDKDNNLWDLSLTLFMLLILANHPHHPLTADDFTMLTDLFN